VFGAPETIVSAVTQLPGQPLSKMRVTVGPMAVSSQVISNDLPIVGYVAVFGEMTGLLLN
jgi:hypothetical protein